MRVLLLALCAVALRGFEASVGADGAIDELAHREERFELTDMLGPWATSKAAWRQVRTALREGRFVTIRDALAPQLAEAMWLEMNATDRWVFRSGFEEDYQFQGSSVMEPEGVRDRALFESVNDLFDFLDAPEVKVHFAEAAGVSLGGPFQGFLSRLNAGDYAAPHTDVSTYSAETLSPEELARFPGGYRRAVAFVCHMTKDWDSSWGGDLVWSTPMTHITPRFNSLTLFPSHNDAWHFVQPVAAHAAKDGMPKRLSISGWWTTTDHAAGEQREGGFSADLCAKLGGCKRAWVGGDGMPRETQYPDAAGSPFEEADRAAEQQRRAERASNEYDVTDPHADHFAAAMAFDDANNHAMVAVAFGAHAKQHSEDANAHMNHAIALMRSEQQDEALVAMSKALALAPTDPTVLENAAVLNENVAARQGSRDSEGSDWDSRGVEGDGD